MLFVAVFLFLSSCAYRFQNTTGRDYKNYKVKKIEELLYIQGPFRLKLIATGLY